MPWRQFLLLCLMIICFFVEFLGIFKSEEAKPTIIEAPEEILKTDWVEYSVITLSRTAGGKEFPEEFSKRRMLCDPYFFSTRFGGETYIGFYIHIPAVGSEPARQMPLFFPENGFFLLDSPLRKKTNPTVEFNNGMIILRMDKIDAATTRCFKNRLLV